MYYYFFAVSILPLSHTSSFSLVFMMAMVAVFSWLLFGEKQTIFTFLTMILCSLGMLLLVQPWLDFNQGFTSMFTKQVFNLSISSGNSTLKDILSNQWLLGISYLILAVAGGIDALYFILAGVHLKKIKANLLIFLTSTVAALVSLFCCLYIEDLVWITDPYVILLVSVHVIGTGLAVSSVVYACQIIGPIQTSIISNFITVFNLIPQYTIFDGYLYGRRNAMEGTGMCHNHCSHYC